MTLTPEQRAAAIEAMARCFIELHGKFRDEDWEDELQQVRARMSAKPWQRCMVSDALGASGAALDAALPIIEAAIVSDKPRDTNGEKP